MAQLTQMDALGALVWALDTFEKPPSERAGGRGSSIDMDIAYRYLCTYLQMTAGIGVDVQTELASGLSGARQTTTGLGLFVYIDLSFIRVLVSLTPNSFSV